MRRALLLLLAIVSCAPVPQPSPAPLNPRTIPSVSRSLTATATARRVVLVSFDGLGADALARQQGLAGFDWLAREGASARVIPVNPTLTSSTHASILTGADPQRTGIVSNKFHIAGTPPDEEAKGMDADIDVETIVEAARRQGKRVGAMFPTVDARTPRRRADFGLVWTNSLTRGRIVQLTRSDFHSEWVPPTWGAPSQRHRSFSPIMRARLEWGVAKRVVADVDVVAYDTTDDRTENYDELRVEAGGTFGDKFADKFGEQEILPDARGWFAVSRSGPDGLYGSWSKILHTDSSLDVSIYWGAVSRTNAYPDSYRTMLDEEVGFWPGAPDETSGIDTATFTEQMQRLARFFTDAQTLTIRRMQFDLFLAYQPEVDESMHPFLGKEGGQVVIRAAFEAADRAVTAIAAALDLTSDALVVTGDHGLVVAEKEVGINRLLADHGFGPRWRAYPSNSVAHLYRFGEPDDADAVVAMLKATGFFEKVERKGATAHRNSGEIIAWGWPNVALVGAIDAPPVATPEPRGQHGALNTNRELQPAFFAVGAGVPPGPRGEIAQTSIARFVSSLVGIAPPAGAE